MEWLWLVFFLWIIEMIGTGTAVFIALLIIMAHS